MTPPPPLVDLHGRSIARDRQLGAAGGEGSVYAIANDPLLVAKVYHPHVRTMEVFEKLQAIVAVTNAFPKLQRVAAWPKSILLDARTRQPVGFTMPRISDDCQPIQHLYNPVQRLKHFPRSTWAFQVRVACNLAAAFEEVHAAGCLVGDVNERNELVSSKAIVWLIDCDSFQVRVNGKLFPCNVGVVHYTPPELQGGSFRGLRRTENHDRFGLAVLIHQLLFVGRHPYMGLCQDDAPFEELIKEFRFAHGPNAHTWGMSPPPHTPTFSDIPPEIGKLFRAAFERGSERDSRPKPSEWRAALQKLEQGIVECPADAGHKYWRGARSCVWCRLAEHGGPEYYFGVVGDAATFIVDEAKLSDVLQRLTACGPFDFPYDRRKFIRANMPPGAPLPENLDDHRSTGIVLGVAIGLLALAIPFGLLHVAIGVGAFLGALAFGIWLAIHISLSPRNIEHRRRRTAHNQALRNLGAIEEQWKKTVLHYRHVHSVSSQSIHRLTGECRGLATRYQIEIGRLASNAQAAAFIRHLRLHLIADAEIPTIGPGRRQKLASCNIFTAADIDENRIRGISGFGDVYTGNLVAWKQEVARQFKFDPASAIAPSDRRSTMVQCRLRQQQILAELLRQTTELETFTPRCQAALQLLVPRLQQAVMLVQQTDADLRVIHTKG